MQQNRNIKSKTENIKQSDRIKAIHNNDNRKGNCFKLLCYQEGNILRKNDKTKSNFETPKDNNIERFQIKGWVKFLSRMDKRKAVKHRKANSRQKFKAKRVAKMNRITL